jgi:hypothetical protein
MHRASDVDEPSAVPAAGKANLDNDGTETPPTEKLVSQRKLEANRRNSKRSSGPRTQRGKSHSRVNAFKHGVFSRLALEDIEAVPGFHHLKNLLESLRQAYPPTSLWQALALEKIAMDLWRNSRALKYEVVESLRKNAFFGEGIDRATRYTALADRIAETAVARLERLDQEAKGKVGAEDEEFPSEAPDSWEATAQAVEEAQVLVGKPPARVVSS